jgi:NTE family protein
MSTTLATVNRLLRSVRAFSREWSRISTTRQQKIPLVQLMQQRRLKLGIALGGGFARGLVHIGVLKALEEAQIPVDFVAGTSVGAIIGACYCSGLSAAEMEEIARAIRFKHFARWTLSRYGLCSNDRMTQFCARVLRFSSFEELKIPLAVTATDFCSGEAVVFQQGPLVPAIRASCAYPGMFLPVEIEGRSYIDGMLAYAVPTTPLRRMGAECVLGVHLSAHWTDNRTPRHLFEVIGQCFSIALARMSDVWKKDADLVLEPDVRGFSYDCFDSAKELIAIGESSARAIMPQLRELLNIRETAVAVARLPAVAPDTSQTTVVA